MLEMIEAYASLVGYARGAVLKAVCFARAPAAMVELLAA